MKARTLRSRLFASSALVVTVLGLSIFLLGYSVIRRDILDRVQKEVDVALRGARVVYRSQIDQIGRAFSLVSFTPDADVEALRTRMNLDYLVIVPTDQVTDCPSGLARQALTERRGLGGTRLLSPEEVETLPAAIQTRTRIAIQDTPRARPTQRKVLDQAMVKEWALPLPDEAGQIRAVAYGGRVVNQDESLVDRIRDLVFGREMVDGKPIGTVTIFQDDVRIATNVLTDAGRRAIGTRVSEAVYRHVVEQGRMWHDRAFVVNDWYKTAYEPIRDPQDRIIGILYVGILEKPFRDKARAIIAAFVAIVLVGILLALVLSYVLEGAILRPLTQMLRATEQMSRGEGRGQAVQGGRIVELEQLAAAFNEMSARLEERETRLRVSNEKLAESNRSYVELIGFVAHELKGLLASAIMNAYSIRDGFLGMINFKQKRAIDSICRNLDYLTATVQKFLNLSRIERGNLEINAVAVRLKTDVFDPALETFAKLIADKQMQVDNAMDEEIVVRADTDLLRIVANNLVNNAAKYGTPGGRIALAGRVEGSTVTVEVYNDGRPIGPEDREKLFKKFSRLDVPEKKKVKGTGLGLYITRQIIEAHGGHIDVEPRDAGNAFIFTLERGE
ncbi:MAG TPA: HAMP domain-containing protein [Phycisphaerales bacterium]|nr:HAMP domain-containing protein [Phycisphaerales bacterium]